MFRTWVTSKIIIFWCCKRSVSTEAKANVGSVWPKIPLKKSNGVFVSAPHPRMDKSKLCVVPKIPDGEKNCDVGIILSWNPKLRREDILLSVCNPSCNHST